ncbi:hypothetical protein BGZ73_000753 [Actinomortierella ambigua]|nr:hypothetical protein BGZ73_000753 [Actinomortierella ambigua]
MSQGHSSSHQPPVQAWATTGVPQRHEQGGLQFTTSQQPAGSLPDGSSSRGPEAPIFGLPHPLTAKQLPSRGAPTHPLFPTANHPPVSRPGHSFVALPAGLIAGPSSATASFPDHQLSQDNRLSATTPAATVFSSSVSLPSQATLASTIRPSMSTVLPRPVVPSQGGLNNGNGGGGGGGSNWIPLTPIPKVPLSKPPPSIQATPVTKIRKRHKVAKSCDGCRQNKFMILDTNLVVSSQNAQLSRSTWGDTPLSPEKVLGVKAQNTSGAVTNAAVGTTASPSNYAGAPVTAAAGPSTPVPILPAIRPILSADPTRIVAVAPKGVLHDAPQPQIKTEPHQESGGGGRPRLQSITSKRETAGGAFANGSDGATDYGRWEGSVNARAHRAAQMARVAPTGILPSGSSSFSSEAVPPSPPTQLPQESADKASKPFDPGAAGKNDGTVQEGQEKSKSQCFQKIAADILSLREHDGAMYLPRHIGRSRGRFWTPPTSATQDAEQMPFRHLQPHIQAAQIPTHLKVLPRDAEYLLHAYFKFSYYYAPIVNKSVALMHLFEPNKQAHNYLLLNILFMGACKHLGRRQDIQRAIEFRDRAKALEKLVDPWKLPRIQTSALGSSIVYGVFVGPRSYMEHVGAYRMTNKDRGHVHPRTLLPTRGSISEPSYQSRLWLFWYIYVRDCINRLYWGWACGIDPCSMKAELPVIEGCVGMGGTLARYHPDTGGRSRVAAQAPTSTHNPNNSSSSTDRRGSSSYVPIAPKPTAPENDRGLLFLQPKSALGKKRESEAERGRRDSSSGKRHVRTAPKSGEGVSSDRQAWRGHSRISDDDDDDDDDDDNGAGPSAAKAASENYAKTTQEKHPSHAAKRPARPYDLLDIQSKGGILLEDDQGPINPSVNMESDEFEVKPSQLQEHLDRMEYLLNAERDTTDDGTYNREIFLREIKLWTIGNRLALYLASHRSVRPKYPTVSFGERQSDVIAATMESGRYSERAWAMDRELQNLQAELIQWERELPDYMRFRMDYDQPDVDHRVNGKLAILTMHYYTITLMLQSAWLPTPLAKEAESAEGRALSSSPMATSLRAPSVEAHQGSTTDSPRHSDVSSPMSTPSTPPSNSATSPNASVKSSSSKIRKPVFQPAFLNTAHEICTELSHVLLRQIELCLTRYPDWCSIQAKMNHCIMVALRVCCINAHLITNDAKTRSEAKAGFATGSVYQKQLAMLPEPLTIRDRPQSEDIRIMEELESDFAKLALIRENMDFLHEAMEESEDENADGHHHDHDGDRHHGGNVDHDGHDAILMGNVQGDAMAGSSGGPTGESSSSDPLLSLLADQDPVAQLETLYSEHFPEIYLKGRLEFGISHEGFGYDFDYEDEWG